MARIPQSVRLAQIVSFVGQLPVERAAALKKEGFAAMEAAYAAAQKGGTVASDPAGDREVPELYLCIEGSTIVAERTLIKFLAAKGTKSKDHPRVRAYNDAKVNLFFWAAEGENRRVMLASSLTAETSEPEVDVSDVEAEEVDTAGDLA